jgi:hypothetical protein
MKCAHRAYDKRRHQASGQHHPHQQALEGGRSCCGWGVSPRLILAPKESFRPVMRGCDARRGAAGFRRWSLVKARVRTASYRSRLDQSTFRIWPCCRRGRAPTSSCQLTSRKAAPLSKSQSHGGAMIPQRSSRCLRREIAPGLSDTLSLNLDFEFRKPSMRSSKAAPCCTAQRRGSRQERECRLGAPFTKDGAGLFGLINIAAPGCTSDQPGAARRRYGRQCGGDIRRRGPTQRIGLYDIRARGRGALQIRGYREGAVRAGRSGNQRAAQHERMLA